VNYLFVNASNQLGEYESGVTVALFGTVPAAVISGIGTVAMTLLWMVLFPSLRELRAWSEAAPGYRSDRRRGMGAIPAAAMHALAGRAALALIFRSAHPTRRGRDLTTRHKDKR
jgi:hypothetical protein